MSARKITPAKKRLAGYPRLKAAWRLLLGAAPLAFPSLAHADATVPAPGQQPGRSEPSPKPNKKPTPERHPRLMGDYSPPEPPSPPPPPPPAPKLPKGIPPRANGGPARVMPSHELPGGITFFLSTGGDHDLVLHPHGPDEPCIHFEASSKKEA